MEVGFTKVSDERHRVRVTRGDGSVDEVELESRSFLRHDLAHYVVESELGLRGGVWGSVAAGGSLSGEGLDGDDMALAERLAGPVQTLMRVEADPGAIRELLDRAVPEISSEALAGALHVRIRRVRGHWKATPYGGEMVLDWPERPRG